MTQPTEPPPSTPLTVEAERNLLKTAFKWQDLRLLVGTIVTVFVSGWFALSQVTNIARAQTDAGLAELRTQTQHTQMQLDRHIEESAGVQKELRGELKEVQADIRALYKAVMTKQPQERLEADGGR